MHGRKKQDVVKPTPEELEKQGQLVRTARSLFRSLLDQRVARSYTPKALETTAKALKYHPEFPTLWCYRRELLQDALGKVTSDAKCKEILRAELSLNEGVMARSTKVYSIWFHRRWALEQTLNAYTNEPPEARSILDRELELCARLHAVDGRNFHCWNHRAHVMGLIRHVAAASKEAFSYGEQLYLAGHEIKCSHTASVEMARAEARTFPECVGFRRDRDSRRTTFLKSKEGVAVPNSFNLVDAYDRGQAIDALSIERELIDMDLSLSKEHIARSLSNYSAWHLRALLQQETSSEERSELVSPIDVAEELEWVQQGLYTDPFDQSIWLYHHWLTALGRGLPSDRVCITHCAVLSGQLFVFLSGSACVRGSVACSSPAVAGGVAGVVVPVGGDRAGDVPWRRTRRLPATRRRWAAAWMFEPNASDGAAVEALLGGEVLELSVELSVESLGSSPDGGPACGLRRLQFQGQPIRCDAEAGGGRPEWSPVLRVLLPLDLGPEQAEVLRGELARVEELLEIEPDCKWALISKGWLGTACAVASGGVEGMKDVQKACSQGYERICGLDPLRRGFYEEARAACGLNLRLLEWAASGQGFDVELNLSGLSLRRLSPTPMLSAFGVRVLSVEGNALRTLGAVLLLQSLTELRASKNQLTGDVTEIFELRRLRRLDVSYNMLELKGASQSYAMPPNLEQVELTGNAAILAIGEHPESGDILSRLLASAEPNTRGKWTCDLDVLELRCKCYSASTS